ncbi:MAG: glycosyltransferase [Eubacterium sp.]|nr:glycosyltransferase [Eubacterium sp.]
MISITIPVYNSEKYLRACIDSVLNQTYTDFELLLVDDGSTDGSGEICDEYAKKDSRVRVFHTPNGGSSAARNYGIDRAQGEYLGFIDSDDEIEPDMYELLYELITKEDADISMCGLADVYGGKVVNPVDKPVYMIMDASESIKTVFEAKLTSVTPVNKLYKKELFEGIRYPLGEDSGEDASIIVDLLSRCKKTVLDNTQKYRYIHREGSITTRQFAPRDLSVIKAYKKNYKLIHDNFPELMDVASMRLCWAYFFVLDKLLLCENRKKYKKIEDKLVAFLRKNTGFIIRDKRFNKTRKIAALVLRFSVGAYKRLVIIRESEKVKQ